MPHFLENMIHHKLATLTPNELLYYSQKYGFHITREEANDIVHYVQTTPVDPFSVNGRMKMLHDLASMTSIQTAQKAQQLFNEIIRSYGLESLFH